MAFSEEIEIQLEFQTETSPTGLEYSSCRLCQITVAVLRTQNDDPRDSTSDFWSWFNRGAGFAVGLIAALIAIFATFAGFGFGMLFVYWYLNGHPKIFWALDQTGRTEAELIAGILLGFVALVLALWPFGKVIQAIKRRRRNQLVR